MKRIPLAQLRESGHWHEALNAGRVVNGVAVEVPDDFPLTAIPVPSPSLTNLGHALFGDLRLADPALQTARLTICQACEHNGDGLCRLCPTCGGRPVTHKVKLSSETCPAGKWPLTAI